MKENKRFGQTNTNSPKSYLSQTASHQKIRTPKKILISKSREETPRVLKLDNKIDPYSDIIFDISIYDQFKKELKQKDNNTKTKSHKKVNIHCFRGSSTIQ